MFHPVMKHRKMSKKTQKPETTTENIPNGWSHNPSASRHRWPLLVGAICGFLIALYLGLFQLDVIHHVWEPFFGDGTRKMLTSSIAQSLPVPDAMLGALAYLAEIITGSIGDASRWRTRPRIVFAFGFIAVCLALVSIVLIFLQPLVVHSWCTLCLCSALISLLIVGPALTEVLAAWRGRLKVQG